MKTSKHNPSKTKKPASKPKIAPATSKHAKVLGKLGGRPRG